MCDKYTIFDHMYITVCTLSYNITSVEYDLVASMLFTKLGSHNVRDQVQSLDVAVQKTGILYLDGSPILDGRIMTHRRPFCPSGNT